MSARPKLAVVNADAQRSPEGAWLALSSEIEALEARLSQLRAARAALKPEIMEGMKMWGLSDQQLTQALRK